MFRASGRLKDLRRNCVGNSTGLSTCRPNGLLPRRFVPSGLCSRSDRIGAFASERPCSGRACSGEACSIRFDLRQGSVRCTPLPRAAVWTVFLRHGVLFRCFSVPLGGQLGRAGAAPAHAKAVLRRKEPRLCRAFRCRRGAVDFLFYADIPCPGGQRFSLT